RDDVFEDLKMPLDESTPLSSLRPGAKGKILSVKSADTDLLRYLDGLGLVPAAEIEVNDYSQFDHNLTIKIGKKSVVLGLNITSQIFVEEN
ncbi:MAG TPA: hypothetical protein DCX53_04840, partial [Anaerolineae bacterium]|nr:hypothetical protein [Anaerolineae bacterium]